MTIKIGSIYLTFILFQPVLSTLHGLNSPLVVTTINSMVGMRGLRHSEVKGLVQGHRPKCGGS